MKVLRTISFLLIITFSAVQFSCDAEMTDKEKVVEYLSMTVEFLKTDEGIDLIRSNDLNEIIGKSEEIAKRAGFSDLKEAESLADVYRDEPEVKYLNEQIEVQVRNTYN